VAPCYGFTVDLELNGRVVLVVGGTGLIGSAVVDRLRAEGATVIPAARHIAEGVQLDARDDDSVRRAVRGILDEHGRIDALVVTAAPAAHTLDPTRNGEPAQVLEAFDGKAVVFLRLAAAVLPSMTAAGYGCIVGVSGQNASVTGNIAGSVRNAALDIMAKNLADDAVGTGVTVNAVNPGTVRHDAAKEVAVGRYGQCTPSEVADVIAFLVSSRGSGISGQTIAVGHHARGFTGLL
jgi:NAD(P)-dependent dehydrogenase (short-subunit alcohol dehydrogenase family)